MKREGGWETRRLELSSYRGDWETESRLCYD
jgi:hypothetical protein